MGLLWFTLQHVKEFVSCLATKGRCDGHFLQEQLGTT